MSAAMHCGCKAAPSVARPDTGKASAAPPRAETAPRLPGRLTDIPLAAPRIQTKLMVSRPRDRYELEADRVADQIMRMPQPGPDRLVQRACKHCAEEAKSKPAVQTKLQPGAAPAGDVLVQRVCYEGECDPWDDEKRERDEPEEDVGPKKKRIKKKPNSQTEESADDSGGMDPETSEEESTDDSAYSSNFEMVISNPTASTLTKVPGRTIYKAKRRLAGNAMEEMNQSASAISEQTGSPQQSTSPWPNYDPGEITIPIDPFSANTIEMNPPSSGDDMEDQINNVNTSQTDFASNSPQGSESTISELLPDLDEDIYDTKSRDAAPDRSVSLADIGMPAGQGRSLSDEERGFFEPRLGRDLSGIRLRDDPPAAETAEQLHARAFTYGGNIVMNRGEYSPGSDSGRRLLAHELAHAVQQGAAGPPAAAGAPQLSATPAPAQVQRMCKSTNRSSGSPEQIVIQSYITRANPSVQKEYQVANSAQMVIQSAKKVKKCFYLDLADIKKHRIYEIKPRHDLGAGANQLTTYEQATRNECIGGDDWQIGTQAEFRELINNALPKTYQNNNDAGPWFLPGIRPNETIEVTTPKAGEIVFETVPIEGLPGRALGKLPADDQKNILATMGSEARAAILSRLPRLDLERALKHYQAPDLFVGLSAALKTAFPDDVMVEKTLASRLPTTAPALITRAKASKTKKGFKDLINEADWAEGKAALLAAYFQSRPLLYDAGSDPLRDALTKTVLADAMASLPPEALGEATEDTIAVAAQPSVGMPSFNEEEAAKTLPATGLRGMASSERAKIVPSTTTPTPTHTAAVTASSPKVAGISQQAIAGLKVEKEFVTWAESEVTNKKNWLWEDIAANATVPDTTALVDLAKKAEGGTGILQTDKDAAQDNIRDLWKWTLRL